MAKADRNTSAIWVSESTIARLKLYTAQNNISTGTNKSMGRTAEQLLEWAINEKSAPSPEVVAA